MEQSDYMEQVERLQDTLEAEAAEYRRLVSLTESERTAILSNDVDALHATVEAKETLTVHLARWAQKREYLTTNLAKEFGLPENAALTDLLAYFEETLAQKLTALREEFISLVERLITLNHGNQMLLRSELVRVESTFDYIKHTTIRPDGHYSARGAATVRPQRSTDSIFNWQI